MSFENLPVEETMKNFFQNPQDYCGVADDGGDDGGDDGTANLL